MGKSEYVSMGDIPVCKRDILVMSRIVRLSGYYEKVLIIDDSIATAVEAKEKIIEFLDSCKNKDGNGSVSELFFYYSGHGDFNGKEFAFLWGDYEKNRKRQTSILNSEIDAMIRRVNPALVVKIVDSCYSGFLYYKGSRLMERYLRSSGKVFNKYYLIFSAQNDRDICGDSATSYFTETFFRSLSRENGSAVRYSDIIDYIVDDFSGKKNQMPLFVVHADNMEVFCKINEEIRRLVRHRWDEAGMNEVYNICSDSILEVVKKDAARYVDISFALSCVAGIGDFVEKNEVGNQLSELYEKKVEYILDYDAIPKIYYIAKWLSGNGSDIYAEVEYDVTVYEEKVPVNNRVALASRGADSSVYQTVEKKQKIAKSYVSKVDVPYAAVSVKYRSKYPNIKDVSLYLVPLLSRTQIFLFYTKVNYFTMGWIDQEIDINSAAWSYVVFDYDMEMIKNGLSGIMKKYFDDVVYAEIIDKFMPTGRLYVADKKQNRKANVWD